MILVPVACFAFMGAVLYMFWRPLHDAREAASALREEGPPSVVFVVGGRLERGPFIGTGAPSILLIVSADALTLTGFSWNGQKTVRLVRSDEVDVSASTLGAVRIVAPKRGLKIVSTTVDAPQLKQALATAGWTEQLPLPPPP